MEEKELEDQLVEAGTKLLDSPPSAVDELLNLLNQVEGCLLKVEQSPSKSMLTALRPAVKALVAKDILKHLDMDVKVAVASCISEITRITAPDAPYDDELMKEIFQIIVTSFEKLHDISSASYSKRVSILETVAKVRSCVVMLDLECDGLILEMFHHFLKAIRESHPENVFSSMETIMTLVIEDSEDISSELLSSLLSSVKNENEDVSPIARRLGEKVIANCAEKLKPCLMQEVQSTNISLNDYSKVVASICQETHDATKHNDLKASNRDLADESILRPNSNVLPQEPEKLEPETHPGEVDPPSNKLAIMSNGTAQPADGDSVVDAESLGKKLEHSHRSSQSKSAKNGTDHLDTLKQESGPDQATKKTRVRKSGSLTHSAEMSDDSLLDSEKVALELPKRKRGRSKEADKSQSEGATINNVTLPSENDKKPELPSLTGSLNENTSVASPSTNQSTPDTTRPKRGRPTARKKGTANVEIDLLALPSEQKGASLGDQIADEAPQSAGVMSKKEQEGNNDLDAKLLEHPGKKANDMNVNENEARPSLDVESKKDPEGLSDSEEKPLRRFSKKVRTGNATVGESSMKLQGEKSKRRKGTPNTEKSTAGESSQKKLVSSPKHTKKASVDDQETPKTKSKRNRVQEKTVEDLSENLVGSRIKVWWPDDKMYYEGVVASFDPAENMHKVLYDDGDQETLHLRNEKWHLIEGDAKVDGEQTTDIQSPDASEMRRKKAKTSSDSSTKTGKPDAPPKRGGASAGKSKDVGPKAGNKSRGDVAKVRSRLKSDEGNHGSKSEEVIPKTGGKSKGDTPKAGSRSKDNASSKSKDETPKADKKSKDDSPKTGRKSRDDTPKEGSKSKEDNTPKVGSKSKDDTPKADSKSKDDTPKAGSKSKDDLPKSGRKSNDDTSKVGGKSRGSTSKTVSKSNANGASAKGKSALSKTKESEDSTKGKSGSSAKAPPAQESESKSGKKRRRGIQG